MVNRPIEIDGIKYFKCKKCGEVKPLNKCYFHINTMFSTGFNSKCKSCVKEERESKPKVKYITRAELEEENRKLDEAYQIARDRVIELLGDIEQYLEHIKELEEENKVIKEEKEMLIRQNTLLQESNKKLKERIDELEKCNLNLQERLDRKEEVNKKMREELSAYDREYFDEDKKAENIFMEEDTLQELKDIGEI